MRDLHPLEFGHPLLLVRGDETHSRCSEERSALLLGQRFAEAIRPLVLPLDRRLEVEPGAALDEVLALATRFEVLSLALPKSLGGRGFGMLSLCLFLEQVSAECLGIANLLATHGLALAVIAATGSLEQLNRVAQTIIGEQRRGRAYLLCTAATEALAGSDLEDVRTLGDARFVSDARHDGSGFVLNGHKVFVSNGSLAREAVVILPLDKNNPVLTLSAFLVNTNTPGFSVERVESKLGQRACPAAELRFTNMAVPQTARLGRRSLAGRRLDLVLGASRAVVAWFGAGAALGLFRAARDATQSVCDQGPVRLRLGRMWQNVLLARTIATEAVLVNARHGLLSFLEHPLARRLDRMVPSPLVRFSTGQHLVPWRAIDEEAERRIDEMSGGSIDLSSAYGAQAKTSTSRLATQNYELLLELLGGEGLREDLGYAKRKRDIRLLSLYEGTDEICENDAIERRLRVLLTGRGLP